MCDFFCIYYYHVFWFSCSILTTLKIPFAKTLQNSFVLVLYLFSSIFFVFVFLTSSQSMSLHTYPHRHVCKPAGIWPCRVERERSTGAELFFEHIFTICPDDSRLVGLSRHHRRCCRQFSHGGCGRCAQLYHFYFLVRKVDIVGPANMSLECLFISYLIEMGVNTTKNTYFVVVGRRTVSQVSSVGWVTVQKKYGNCIWKEKYHG